MTACVFCQIVRKDAPALIVRETETAIAFLPIWMEIHGHTLVSPKAHFADLYDITPAALADVSNLARELAVDFSERIGATGANLMLASGKDGEQSDFYFHFHLLPRFRDDGLKTWPPLPPFKGDREAIHQTLIGQATQTSA